jgi:hypothetical protein
MPQRKAFLLRIDPAVLDAIQKWADDDLRSLNAQIEYLLRRALADAHRLKSPPRAQGSADQLPPGADEGPPGPS